MKKLSGILIAAGALFFAIENSASAQSRGYGPSLQRSTRPTTSPYLFLTDPRSATGFDYYRRIRPEQQLRAATNRQAGQIRGLQRDLRQTQQELRQAQNSQVGPTGHSTSFFSYGSYFGRRR